MLVKTRTTATTTATSFSSRMFGMFGVGSNAGAASLAALVLFLALVIGKVDLGQALQDPPPDRFHYDPTDWMERIYGPPDWNLVLCDNISSCPGWPTDWQNFNPFIPYNNETENMCMDCSHSITGNCYNHRQSPIPLNRNVTATAECNDRHLMRYGQGMCSLEKMDFQILPHVLRAYQPSRKCRGIQPWIDFSLGFPDPWLLKFTDISVPSQHIQDGKRYDAEVVLSHVYSKNNPKKLIGNLGIFLQKGRKSDHYDFLELYIQEWKATAQRIKTDCNLRRRDRQLGQAKSQQQLLRRTTATNTTTSAPVVVVAVDDDANNNLTSIISDDLLVPNLDDDINDDDANNKYLYSNHHYSGIPIDDPHRGVMVQRPYFNRSFQPYDWYAQSKTEYYFRYVGSLLEPPCFQSVHWRVLKDPIKVAPKQIQALERLIADRIDPVTCQKYTAGSSQRFPNRVTWRVGVNRPLQAVSERHNLVYCECIDFVSKAENDKAYCLLPMEKRGVMNFTGVSKRGNSSFTANTNPAVTNTTNQEQQNVTGGSSNSSHIPQNTTIT